MNPADALELLKKNLASHGLTARGWSGALDSAERRFGVCKASKKEITISRVLVALNPEEEVLDTILHEIAHALAFIEHGENCGHDARWKTICRRIGARPKRCYDDDEVETPSSSAKPWMLVHRETNEIFGYHRNQPKTDLAEIYIRGRKDETLGKLEIRPNPAFTQGTCDHFDGPRISHLQARMLELLQPLAEEMGLTFKAGGSRFSPAEATIGIHLQIPQQDGLDSEERAFREQAPYFGLTSKDYRRPFQSHGETFLLIALKPKNRKYPIIGLNGKGRRFKFPFDVLESF